MRVRSRHFATGQPLDLVVEAGRVVSAGDPDPTLAADLAADFVAPSFCDVQVNGCDGISFNAPDLTAEQVRRVVDVCRRHGIGRLLPTLITGPFEDLAHGFRTLRQAREADPAVVAAIPGYHLEGPYISPEDGYRGAHPRAHVRPPATDEFARWQDAAGGRIRMVTVAPELPGALPFIEHLAASGVVVALGHTAADGATVRAAVRAGARVSTHLGNGTPAVLPRHANPVWEQLAEDGLWASVIADGHHLPAAVLQVVRRAKTPGRLLLTCDASSLAGLPPGRYRIWGGEYEVAVGRVVVPGTPYLAGSAVFTDACVAGYARLTGASLTEAVELASVRPRELLGLPVPDFSPGSPAELVLYDAEDGRLIVRGVVG
jgi:N-acetylglucosamine-6-phosphate deacetylase